MMSSRWEAGNGLFSGYKKAEEVARKKSCISPLHRKSARGGQAQVRMVCFLLF